ncbi:hypothetical protein R6Q59_010118 [Mikania micrantha]
MKPDISTWRFLFLSLLSVITLTDAHLAVEDSFILRRREVAAGASNPTSTAASTPKQPSSVVSTAPYSNLSSPASNMTAPTNGLRSVIYFTNWGIYPARNFPPTNLSALADSYTHILYSFAKVENTTGEVILSDGFADVQKHFPGDKTSAGTNVYGCIKQLYLLKKQHRKLKVLLSIGGWSFSANLSVAFSTAAGRQMFVDSSVRLLEDLGFDGIDIDYEYPLTPQQNVDYVTVLQLLRATLNNVGEQRGMHFLMSGAVAAGASHYKNYRVAEMNSALDFWNVMTYDFTGSWDKMAGHQTNLHKDTTHPASTPTSVDDALAFYVSHGVSPDKIVLGMPLYGRSFVGTDGPGTPYQTVGNGSAEPGVWDYKVLPQTGAQEYNDANVGASWSYDNRTRTFISYDTPAMSKVKAAYVQQKALGGGMWWDASSDKPKGQGSLVEAFITAIGGSSKLDQQDNCLSYPNSKYDNLKNNFPNK